MRLLVSVRNAAEAAAALVGGADIIDAKEPLNGALGPVTPATLAAIAREAGSAAPVSVALGDAGTADVADASRAASRSGAAFVKLGFAGLLGRIEDAERAAADIASSHPGRLVIVAYADHPRAAAPPPEQLVAVARACNAAAVLLDTFDKHGASLTALMTPDALRRFVACAKEHGQLAALAGTLTAADIAVVRDAGADIAGVRGAACDGGRTGTVSVERVRLLRSLCEGGYVRSSAGRSLPAI